MPLRAKECQTLEECTKELANNDLTFFTCEKNQQWVGLLFSKESGVDFVKVRGLTHGTICDRECRCHLSLPGSKENVIQFISNQLNVDIECVFTSGRRFQPQKQEHVSKKVRF